MTIVVAFNAEEAGYYLSTFKQFEHKPPDMISERVDKDYSSMLRSSLTSISKVNKTDVETLRTAFGVSVLAPYLLNVSDINPVEEFLRHISCVFRPTSEFARLRSSQGQKH